MGVFLGLITGGDLRVETCRSLLLCATTPDTPVSHTYLHTHGPYLDDARNKVIEAFLRSTCDHLLFVDSDIEFTVDDIRTLLDATSETQPVVGGIYYSGSISAPKAPVVYDLDIALGADDGGPFIQLDFEDPRILQPLFDDRQPFPVGAIGTGFLCIHRTVLDKLAANFPGPTPWFAEETVNDTHLGEDMTFCLRIQSIGHVVLAHPGVSPRHFKISRY